MSSARAVVVKRQVLFCPGPVNTHTSVHAALGGPDLCHREPEFSEILNTVRAKLLHVLSLEGRYQVAIVSGSGTASLESAILASAEGNKKMLVLNNGVYGSRLAQIAKVHGIGQTEVRSPVLERLDLDRVAAALKRDSAIGTVAMVHQETSTGMLNPLEAVGALTKKYHKRFLVDAISSLGAEKMDLAKNNISMVVGSAGKALHGPVGLSFVLVSSAEAARIAKAKPRSFYLDLGTLLKFQEAGDTPFTPAVPLVVAFHAAVNELIKEGLKTRIARYQERATVLRTGFKKIGLKTILDEKLLSNSLTALWLPKGLTYLKLHDSLKRQGFIIYSGQSELKNKIFRVANMGQLLKEDLQGFLKALKGIVGNVAQG